MAFKHRYTKSLYFLVALLPLVAWSQNPLKKELKTSTTQVYYSPSAFNFTEYKNEPVYISELNDNRSANWNKQINDSIRIDLIRDFWNYPYKSLFKNKINQDLSKQKIKIDFAPAAGQYVIEPTVDAHYPNYVSYPKKGYYVYTKVNMKVSKDGAVKFNKAYQDYYFFSKEYPGYNDDYSKDYYEGTNAAMWIGMRNTLDKFYADLNDIFANKVVSGGSTALTVKAVESNIADDKNLITQQKSYSDAPDKKVEGKDVASNYKVEETATTPPPVANDPKLDIAVSNLGKEVKTTSSEVLKSNNNGLVKLDSNALAIRKAKEEARKRAIDSAMRVKESLAKSPKSSTTTTPSNNKAVRDSIIKANKEALALKIKERATEDSIRKAKINEKVDLAKRKREEKKKEMGIPTTPPQQSYTITTNTNTSSRTNTNKTNGNISEEIRRIAREIEQEDMGKPVTRMSSTTAASTPPSTVNTKAVDAEKIKAEREAKLAALRAEREAKLAALKAEAEKKALALKAEKEAKRIKDSTDKVERLAKLAKLEEAKRLASIKPVDPKKYAEDSIKLEEEKRKKREAILAAQRAAVEAERKDLSKDPNAGEMFAKVSTDPPSKLPDNRSREQVLADRIFTPKNDVSKELLARVKLITPEEEMRMLQNLKTGDMSSVDSAFIDYQKNRPLPSTLPKSDSSAAKSGDKSKKEDKNSIEAIKQELKKANSKEATASAKLAEEKSKKIEAAKEEIKKEIVEKSLKTTTSTPTTPAAAASTPASNTSSSTSTKSSTESKLDDDIKKKAEMLKKKAEGK